jgi:hypothetical protein
LTVPTEEYVTLIPVNVIVLKEVMGTTVAKYQK